MLPSGRFSRYSYGLDMAMQDVHHPGGPEMPIFTRTFDLLPWLRPSTNHFPRAHRHTFTRRLLDAASDLERLEEANIGHGAARLERLDLADEALAHIRAYLRLATRFREVNAGMNAKHYGQRDRQSLNRQRW